MTAPDEPHFDPRDPISDERNVEEPESDRSSDWIKRQADDAKATVDSWPAWKRNASTISRNGEEPVVVSDSIEERARAIEDEYWNDDRSDDWLIEAIAGFAREVAAEAWLEGFGTGMTHPLGNAANPYLEKAKP